MADEPNIQDLTDEEICRIYEEVVVPPEPVMIAKYCVTAAGGIASGSNSSVTVCYPW